MPYVFDSGRFSWNLFLNCDTGFAFYFERELYFFLTRKTVFSKKNSPKLYFFLELVLTTWSLICIIRFLVSKFQPILKGLRQTAFRENVYHSLLQEKHLCLVLIMLPHKIQYLSDLALFQLLLQVL